MTAFQTIAALDEQARAALENGDHERAKQAYLDAIALAAEMDRPALVAALFLRLGRTLELAGEVQDAVIAYESGMRALDEEERQEVRDALERLGLMVKGYDPGGRFRDAPMPAPQTETDLLQAEKDPALAIRLLISIGNAYLRQPQPGPAIEAYEAALAHPGMADEPLLQAQATLGLALAWHQQGDLAKAQRAAEEALARFQNAGGKADSRHALSLLADILAQQGRLDEAVARFEEALPLYQLAQDPRGEAKTLAGLGEALLALGRIDDAQSVFLHALAIPAIQDDLASQWRAERGLGRCAMVRGQWDEAARRLERSLILIQSHRRDLRTDQGRVAFSESVRAIRDALVQVHLQRAQMGANDAFPRILELVETHRGQALLDLMRGRVRRRAHLTSPKEEPDATPGPNLPLPEVSDRGFNMTSQMAMSAPIDAEMAHSLGIDPARAQEQPPQPPMQVDPLPRLVYHVLPDRTVILGVTASGQVTGFVLPLGEEAIAQRVREVRQALGTLAAPSSPPDASGNAQDFHRLLSACYDDFIAPVFAAIGPGPQPLVIEPDRALWLLPFAALLAPTGEHLIDQRPLIFTPSSQVLDDIRGEPPYAATDALRALIVGNPAMPEIPWQGRTITLKPLVGALIEADAVAKQFPPERRTLLTGKAATEKAVRELAPEHTLLHLATHGLARDDAPLDSFVALAPDDAGDGLLTAWNVMDLSLPAELVVLSACQTGLGYVSGEGVIGLSRAFLAAGARSVLVSLWNVDDVSTGAFMRLFYRAWLTGESKAVALQQAMQIMRQVEAHPRYWAAFILMGAS